ncbi:MAG: lipoyl(octanoyl) transferase LipB [Flavobacteriales bacterium TMED191]|nr:MAG: lipoyl(octanoyl) transferase LipB [Flavobacteriales bacterium TMED191]|tara:strand:- start:1094 stop:1777 length:684 start_codon:yes stop_codon:yes gene_type:complete
MNTVIFKNLGIVDFKTAWDKQELLLKSIIKDKRSGVKTKNYLLFCQHPHVYTLGKSGDSKNLLINEAQLKKNQAAFYKINRGGDITYHGPGQLVVYPIFDLDNFFTDIHKYLRYLEQVVIDVLRHFDLCGERLGGSTGVWVSPKKNNENYKKICAMGVRASRWVTMHGLAFNVNVDLNYFNNIVPCGIQDRGVTSLCAELDRDVPMKDIELLFKKSFENVFNFFLKT